MSADTNSHASITRFASVLLRDLRDSLNVPSLSVAVSRNDTLVWADACGFADIENGRIADTNTVYRIGSTSKALTSVAVMLLYQNGKIDLDAPLNSLLDNYPEKKWQFTMRQLLSHTAGMPDYEDLGFKGIMYSLLNFKQFSSVEHGLIVFKDVPLLFEPGTDFKYNSFGPVLASRVLEVLTNESFQDYMNKNIFRPIKMNHTFFDQGSNNNSLVAKFYETNNKGLFRNWHTFGFPKQTQNLSYKWAGGGFLSTPSDLVKLGAALIQNDSFVNSFVKKEFFTLQKLKNGEVNPNNYALGWRVAEDYTSDYFKKDKKVTIIHHAGVSKGSMNFLCLFPNEKIVVNLSTNGRSENIDFSPFWNSLMQLSALFINGHH